MGNFSNDFGKILYTRCSISNDIKEISNLGINKIKIEYKSASSANKIVNEDILKEYNIKVYIANYMMSGSVKIFGVWRKLDAIKSEIPIIGVICFKSHNIVYSQAVKIIFTGRE